MGMGSIPTGFGGFGGAGGSTIGMTGGQANFNPNTTAAVSDDKGGLKAYDPTTMAETRAPVAAAQPVQNTVPDYITNWLQAGGQSPTPVMKLGMTGDTSLQSARGALTASPKPKVAQTTGAYNGVKTPTTTPTAAPPAPTSTFVKPMQGKAPVYSYKGQYGAVNNAMLDKISPAGIKAILGGDYGHPDLQFAGAARYLPADQNFYNYATWRLGTAGMGGTSAATQDPYILARNQPGAQLDANGRPYTNPGYYNSGYGGSNSS